MGDIDDTMRRLDQVDAPDLWPPRRRGYVPPASPEPRRRRLHLVLAGTASALVLIVAVVVAIRAGGQPRSEVRTAGAPESATTSATTAAPPPLPILGVPVPSSVTLPTRLTTPAPTTPTSTTVAAPPQPTAQTGYADFAIPTVNSGPLDITIGPDGRVWFTEAAGNKIGRLNPADGTVTELPLPAATARPSGITTGPDGALWFTEAGVNRIGRMTTDGAVKEYAVPTTTGNPLGLGGDSAGLAALTTGPDGALWFTESLADKVGRITTSGEVTEYELPDRSSIHGNPGGIATGNDGALWFTEQLGNRIDRLDPATGRITSYPVPSAAGPVGLVALAGGGANGSLWFGQAGKIGRIATGSGAVTMFDAAAANTPGGEGVAVSPLDKAVWFTESRAGKLGRMTPRGDLTEIPVPRADAGLTRIAVDATGRVWFTEASANRIGRLAPG